MKPLLPLITGIGNLLLPAIALAALPPANCGTLPGCGAGYSNVLATSVIPRIASMLLMSAASISLLVFIGSAGRYVVSAGKDEQQQKAKKGLIWALAGASLCVSAQVIVQVLMTENFIGGGPDPLLNFFGNVARIMVSFLNVAFLGTIIYGGMIHVIGSGKEEEIKKGRYAILYAILGAILVNLAPTLVAGFLNIF
jgi:hypothetical protein